MFRSGERVKAEWTDGKSYTATIQKLNDNGTYTVKYESDGKVSDCCKTVAKETEESVDPPETEEEFVRLLKQTYKARFPKNPYRVLITDGMTVTQNEEADENGENPVVGKVLCGPIISLCGISPDGQRLQIESPLIGLKGWINIKESGWDGPTVEQCCSKCNG